jgi:hypothetical protein
MIDASETIHASLAPVMVDITDRQLNPVSE